METGSGEEAELADDGHSQNSATDECLISPIISQETLQSLEYLINPDEFSFHDFVSNDNDQNHSEIASLTKLNALDPELANYQADSPQGSFTRTRSIAVKIEPPNDPDDLDLGVPIEIDRAGPSLSASPFLNNSGVYGFDLYFNETENPTKSVAFTYSSKLDKLYVSVNKSCPFNFVLASRPPVGCLIRAVLYYKDPVYIHNAVERCPAHREKKHPLNNGFDYPDHIIRCDSLEASYEQHPLTKRCSVMVPYQDADPSLGCNSINYSFTCFSSCYGINRRSTAMVFTLEHGGLILGQKVVELRICACPGRDRFKDEKKLAVNDKSEADGEKLSIKRPIQSEEVVTLSKKCDPPNKKCKVANGELITVSVQFQVRGRFQAEIYQGILNSIKESAKNNYSTAS